MEGAIVFCQRALRAEPAETGAVAAIKIITRTECHCACPKGTTSKGEREDPIRSPRQQTAFITELAPKKGTLSSAGCALTCPIEDLDGDSPCCLPNSADIPDELCTNPAALRLWPASLTAILESLAFSQPKHAIATHSHNRPRSNPIWNPQPLYRSVNSGRGEPSTRTRGG